MCIKFKKIAIIGTHYDSRISKTVKFLCEYLSQYAEIFLEEKTSASIKDYLMKSYSIKFIANNCDLAIIVGGDGNFVKTSCNLSIHNNIPVIGVNRGKFGFLTDINPKKIQSCFFSILKGDYYTENRIMLKATIKNINNNPSVSECIVALNDLVLSTEQHSKLFQIKVEIDEQYAFDQRLDGMIISTPTGSTAHALSAGSPIIHPSVNAIIIIPMFSHSLNSRPIIVDAKSLVKIKIAKYNNPITILNIDGHTKTFLPAKSEVTITKHNRCVTFLHPKNYDYFYILRSKLHWEKKLF